MTIIFVSEMHDLSTRGSSTQIMAVNILKGLKNIGNTVIFIAIIDKGENIDSITSFFNGLADKVICLHSRLNLSTNPNKYVQLFRHLRSFICPHKYPIMELCASLGSIPSDTLIISHNPPFEAAMIARQIKNKLSLKRYYQYWSDPYALAGITPENFSFKRYLSYVMEAYILHWADRIIYGTYTLGYFQRKLFPFYRKKIHYVDIPHSGESNDLKAHGKYTAGYFGGYNSRYRNIFPLCEVIRKHTKWSLLICGTGIPPVTECSNIKVFPRIPQCRIADYERQTNIHVSLLNFNNIQIPGKIFYQTNQKITILVILDGPYKKFIYQYLKLFDRFEFCENTESSITSALSKISSPDYQLLRGNLHLMDPEKIAVDIINGGLPIDELNISDNRHASGQK